MNKRIREMALFFVISLSLIIMNLSYLQTVGARRILKSPANKRALAEESTLRRGRILARDGSVLAESVPTNGTFSRLYPEGESVSSIVGFNSIKYGRSAVELEYNDFLLAKTEDGSLAEFFGRLAGNLPPGNDVVLTIDLKVQKVAAKTLAGKRGAIVALDPDSGAVLAMATSPTFDPTFLDERWPTLIDDAGAPLINRAILGLYPPGSSFKVLSAAAAIDARVSSLSQTYPAPSKLGVGGGLVSNYDKKDYGELTLKSGFALSANTVFARVGLDLGAKSLVDYAERFGFNKEIDFELATKKSVIPKPSEMDDLELAWTTIGQGELLATPLQMAMITSTVANQGRLLKPFLVERVVRPSGETVLSADLKELARPIGPSTAAAVTEAMVEVVRAGTGTAAAIDGILVAGKTGTAELESGGPHAWFVGFAPANNPKVAVAVIIENGGVGGRVAAPLARLVMKEALAAED